MKKMYKLKQSLRLLLLVVCLGVVGTASAQLSKSQIIQQAATAMLAQANQSAQSVLALLK